MRSSEQRARSVARELLSFRGWDLRPVWSGGQLFEESEFRGYRDFLKIFEGQSKSGPGIGKPDFLLVDSAESRKPLVVIDTKPSASDIKASIRDTNHYGNAIRESGRDALSVAIAGAEKEICEVRVQRFVAGNWQDLTLHERPIDWIPSPTQTARILSIANRTEVAPERPPDSVLAEQAERLNEILRECKVKDEYRPVYAATFMLAMWYGDVSTEPDIVLEQINTNASKALKKAGKAELSSSLRVDTENEDLSLAAWKIIDILKKLNIRSFMQEHDYLGQLYETFFRYTGGNTIGQYFTPRHIIDMMCDVVDVRPDDRVFDPACGTGGFLIGALRRMVQKQNLSYEEAVARVKSNVFGIESEPATAALCITNMILRGDGKSGIVRANCFKLVDYPPKEVDVSLLNPPFPHSKEDRPATDFIDRAQISVRHRGYVASVVPYSLLVKTGEWHRNLLKNNRLAFVATMPADLFQPYAAMNTAVLVFEKGVPHEDGNVFFARLWNDGYKLKKNVRGPVPGSQIDQILDEFQRRRSVPELTAYAPVTPDTVEWSPEAFIESAAHTDMDFIHGFEQSLRNHSAFYVSEGYRLVGAADASGLGVATRLFRDDSGVSLQNVTWGPFPIKDYFDIALGGKDEIEDIADDGETPIVSTSSFNNGVTAWRRANITYRAPAITVATDGSTGSSFVQEVPFYAFYKVAILRPKQDHDIPVDALYFLAYLMSRESWRYVYARKFGKGRLITTVLQVPIRNGAPDFNLMAELTRQCSAFPIVASFREAYARVTGERFRAFAQTWRETRVAHSSVGRMTDHDAYRSIIKMGHSVVPFILNDLRATVDHWFIALHEITGADPVPEADRGKLDRMSDAWWRWGKDRGLVQ
jgi:hypothetical protein